MSATSPNWIYFRSPLGLDPNFYQMNPVDKQRDLERFTDAFSDVPLPPERKLVLIQIEPSEKDGLPASVAVGYLRYAAGDEMSPFFVSPGVGRRATAYADYLPQPLNAKCWPGFCDEETLK